MGVILAIAHQSLRECQRRPFPYALASTLALLALASQLFQGFSFGAAELESANLAISAVFLGGLLHAAFLGTQLVRVDLERGTLGLLLSQPASLPRYLLGRYLGLAGSALLQCAMVAGLVALLFLLPAAGVPEGTFGPALLAGWLRALLPVLLLEAAALAISALASRIFAPLLLVALFAGGSLAAVSPLRFVLPDFSLFALEAGPAPGWPWMIVYTFVFTAVFLLIGFVALAERAPLKSQS